MVNIANIIMTMTMTKTRYIICPLVSSQLEISLFGIKVDTFFLKVVMENKLDTIISGSYNSDFAYPSLIVKKLEIRYRDFF